MTETATIARPYAKAAFELAIEEHQLDRWANALRELAMIARNSEMHTVILDPTVRQDTIFKLFFSVPDLSLNDQQKNFLHLLIENDRLSLLPHISDQFDELKNAHDSTVDAEIFSAFPISDADLSMLATSLEKRFKRKIKPTLHVNNELIGGVKVIVGDEVLDSSVRSQLQSMSAALQSENPL